MDPKKAAAEWFRATVFKEEPIRPRPPAERTERLPSALQAARALADKGFRSWQSKEEVFLKQGKLLEFYTDSYSFDCDGLTVYYPTYQALNDRQLRAYFSWRTQVRQENLCKAPLSFAFLYIYELLNQIGVEDPLDGYHKLAAFRDGYGQLDGSIRPYLARWLTDYVVYYDLDPELLSGSEQMVRDRCIAVLETIAQREDGEIMAAVGQYSRWLGRSKFYAGHREEMDRVTAQVLRGIAAHCAHLKSTMADRYFGPYVQSYETIFSAAVFCDPLKRREYRYMLSEVSTYTCKNGIWVVCRREPNSSSRGKLDELLKAIDAALRGALDYGRPIKTKPASKWIQALIENETGLLLAEKRAAEARKVTIDFGQLSRIRQDAGLTREKLIVDEDLDEPAPPATPLSAAGPGPAEVPEPAGASEAPEEQVALSPEELRLLRCLLYGGGTGWVEQSGHLLSVLADGINEKLYDTFADNVLDDTPQVVEDYIDDLKEMVCP